MYYEELMGEEGFSSDSSLLYHRGVPSAIVDSQVWDLPAQTTGANHPLRPRHLRLHDLFDDKGEGRDPVTGRRLVLGNGDVRLSYVVAAEPPRSTATRSATSASTSRPAPASWRRSSARCATGRATTS